MTISVFLRFLAIALPALLASCAKPAYQARGYASYIADQYAGRYTSSGAVYQPQGWTAAHNTLPFGTVVKVKNNANGRTVNVTVNDRFPLYPNRIINLSRAAAEYIQIPYYQLGDVTVTARTVAGSTAPATSYPTSAPGVYTTPPPSNYPAQSGYGAPAPANYTPAQQTPVYPNKPAKVPPAGYGTGAPPAGYGTSSPPAGLPPPPPGYR